MIDDICAEIKKDEYHNSEFNFSESKQGGLLLNYTTNASRGNFIKQLEVLCKTSGFDLSLDEKAGLFLPNTDVSLKCYAWMKSHFSLIGDFEPNSQEIHLEPCYIKDVYEEYKLDQLVNGDGYSKKTQFGLMWQKCFP